MTAIAVLDIDVRICVPTADDSGLDAALFEHTGRAPFYTIVDTESGAVEAVRNESKHMGGTKMPPTFIADHDVDTVLVGHIGKRGVKLFEKQGIDLFKVDDGTVGDLVERFDAGELEPMRLEDAHGHGDHDHGHHH